jgi:hypothetical protein
MRDPTHRWRADTGIELVHEEPSWDEFQRIVQNWKRMSPYQKVVSDAKSIELFGCDNMVNAKQLEAKMRLKYQKNLEEDIRLLAPYKNILTSSEQTNNSKLRRIIMSLRQTLKDFFTKIFS